MPSVSDCPYCGQRTGIPENLDPETMVRCPICAYEFALDHALMYAEEAPPEHIAEFPPELIPVSAAAATDAAPPGETEAPAEAAASADAAGAPVESAATESAAVSQEQSEAEGAPKADAAPADDGGAAAGATSALEGPSSSATAASVVVENTSLAWETSPLVSETTLVGLAEAAATDASVELIESPPPDGEITAGVESIEAAVEPGAEAARSALVSCSTEVVAETASPGDQALGVSLESAEAAAERVVREPPEGPPGPAEQAAPEEHEEVAHEVYVLAPPTEGEAAEEAAVPAWRQQRKAHPVRNLIGLVVSGMLGLAAAYGFLNWLGPKRLKFWSHPTPPVSRPASEAESRPKPAEAGVEDGFKSLENRTFEVPKDVEPSRPAKATKGPGARGSGAF